MFYKSYSSIEKTLDLIEKTFEGPVDIYPTLKDTKPKHYGQTTKSLKAPRITKVTDLSILEKDEVGWAYKYNKTDHTHIKYPIKLLFQKAPGHIIEISFNWKFDPDSYSLADYKISFKAEPYLQYKYPNYFEGQFDSETPWADNMDNLLYDIQSALSMEKEEWKRISPPLQIVGQIYNGAKSSKEK